MSSDIVIKADNLGKCYQIYEKPQDRLKQSFFRGLKQYYTEFWALRDVSFEIKKGEAVGIIGRNGSGKSTLLQMICGILTPTTGVIEVSGKIAALLELGAGFNPDFTGRENVYINGAIMGLERKGIDTCFDAIETFADIGEFIDQPVKTYSSGMLVRLAFAIQVAVEPEVLIVDEALSVGDIFFQQKCLKRIRELREKGTTLLFVSHDMGIVRDLCDKGIYLKNGKLAFWGQNISAIRNYLSDNNESLTVNSSKELLRTDVETKGQNELQDVLNTALWTNTTPGEKTGAKAELLAIGVYDADGYSTQTCEMGAEIIFRVLYRVYTDEPVHVAIEFKNKYNQIVTATGSYPLGTELLLFQHGDKAIFELRLDMMLEAGLYTFCVNVGRVCGTSNGVVLHETPWLGPVQVNWDYNEMKPPFMGMCGIPAKGIIMPVDSD